MMEFPPAGGWSRDTRKQFEGNTMAGGTRTPVTKLTLTGGNRTQDKAHLINCLVPYF